ncbi:MAG TPA: hypothetical protein ENK25_10640 [Bacteroidetes bacterium]|nr:hypothetical protein [Bacteroidota bacterium]
MNNYLKELSYHSNKTPDAVEYASLLTLIKQSIEKLPHKRQQIFRLSRYEGLSNKEIVKQLGFSARTIETQIYEVLNLSKKVWRKKA